MEIKNISNKLSNPGIIFCLLMGSIMLFSSLGIILIDDRNIPDDYVPGNIEEIIGVHAFNWVLSILCFLIFIFCVIGFINEWKIEEKENGAKTKE